MYFTVDFQKLTFHRFSLTVSITTIKRARKKLGWVKSGVCYCQLVTEKNRIKGLEFTHECMAREGDFSNVIFTDESSIWLECHAKVCF